MKAPHIARVEYRVDSRGRMQILMINRSGQCFFTEATPRLLFLDFITSKKRKP